MTGGIDAIFREELRDLLDGLERGLLDLKARPDDAGLVNQVFRDLHTIKGSGAMFGFAGLAAFVHEFETVFDRVRSGALVVGPELLRLALAARDEMPGLAEGRDDPAGRRQAILAGLRALTGEGAGARGDGVRDDGVRGDGAATGDVRADVAADVRADVPGGVSGPGAARLRFRLTGPSLALGARPDLLLEELRGLGATGIRADLTDVPPLDLLDVDSCAIAWTMDLPPNVTRDALEDVFLFVDADWHLAQDAAAVAPAPAAEVAPAVGPEVAAASGAASGAVSRDVSGAGAAPSGPAADAAAPDVGQRPELRPELLRPEAAEGTALVRVPAGRLDALMDSVGELVIAEARLSELARQSRDSALIATAEQITRLAAGLRDATMTMRMVPMRSIVGRFRRLVADLSDRLGKPVDFRVTGEETELDKTVIDKLADPLMHVLRNAIDHGMEDPEARVAAGKPARGTITLSARQTGAEVVIRLADDGRGMDAAKIRARAVAQGLIASDAVLGEAQMLALVLEPGFSTAEQVTELSGRGVGMDVVRRTIETLRGSLQIESAPGQGTTVTLRLPLTLAIIGGLLVEVAGERYTLPLHSVQEILELPAEKVTPRHAGEFLDVRGRFVPFLRLRQLFGCGGDPGPMQNVVIVMAAEQRVGIVVDRIVGTNQTVIKQMSRLHAGVRAVSGATILADGSVALILDAGHLVGLGRARDAAAAREVAA